MTGLSELSIPEGRGLAAEWAVRHQAAHLAWTDRVVLLGASDGPPRWNDSHREGVASAVVVGDKYDLIDAGDRVGKQIGAHTTIKLVEDIAERAGVKKLVLDHLVPGNWSVGEWEEAGENFSGEPVTNEDFDAID